MATKKHKSRAKSNSSASKIPTELKREANRLKRTGVIDFDAKTASASALRSKIKRAKTKHGSDLDADKTHFIPLPKNKRGQLALNKAAELGLKTTKKGFFFQRERKDETVDIKITKTGKATVEVRSKTKNKETGRTTTRKKTIPLRSVDELAKRENKMEDEIAKVFANKKKGEVVSFRVTEKGRGGYSRDYFSDPQALMNHLKKYGSRSHLDTPTKQLLYKNYFFRHVEIITTTRSELKTRNKTAKGRKHNKTGRSR